MNKQNKKKLQATSYKLQARGFTLIEFLVVLSIVIFIIPSVFGLIYSLLRQQSRVVALQEVKRQGDLAFNHIKTTINNSAVSTHNGPLGSETAICATAPTVSSGSSSMYFLDATGVNVYFGYKLTGTNLTYERTSAASTALTNSSVVVSDLVWGCTKNSEFAPPLVNASYTVTQTANNVSLSYKTLIKLNTH